MVYIPFPSTITTPYGPGHNGIDFAASAGTSVPAAASGVVLWSRQMGTPGTPSDFGQTVVILHQYTDANGNVVQYTTWYTHLNGQNMPAEGDPIFAGDKIGEVGSTGYSIGPHLHFEINEGNDLSSDRVPIDPNTFDYGGSQPFNWYADWLLHKLDGTSRDPFFKLLEIYTRVDACYTSAQRFIQRRDPLTLDLDGDGLETTGVNATNPIMFDHDGDGVSTATGWVLPDDGFLVLDRNGNGQIDNGTELFGDSTPLDTGMGTFYFSGALAFRGRPRGRRLASSPRRLAVRETQAEEPKGAARFTLLRRAESSIAVSGAFTRATQLRGRGTGLSWRNRSLGRARLDQRQFSARLTSLARNGLRST